MKRAWGRRWVWALLSGWALVAVPQAAAGLSEAEAYALYEKASNGDSAAMAQLRQAAEQGDAEVQTALGVMYKEGEGVPQDDAQAVVWFRKAAEQGNAKAQAILDLMVRQGRR